MENVVNRIVQKMKNKFIKINIFSVLDNTKSKMKQGSKDNNFYHPKNSNIFFYREIL